MLPSLVGRFSCFPLLVALFPGLAVAADAPLAISGRHPSLAMSNQEGECGVGAVVPWADRLWVMTYAPHKPRGSDDKLYEIDVDLTMTARPESVGGTPAGRLIHRESGQLVMGPYFIDRERRVRVVPPAKMPGRLTAVARHLQDPAGKVYVYDMEGALYEVAVSTLEVTRLFDKPVPGWHGKGAYTAQGRLVVANNGELAVGRTKSVYLAGTDPTGPEESGALAEWDGGKWRVVERRQFTEVTGPGGVEGAPDDRTPLWSVGWDRRSLLFRVLDRGSWHTFRLPRADASYDGTHGWHTEWPRIRQVVPGDAASGKFLMNMHGGWFELPGTFSAARPTGLRPIGNHLKVTADFAPWKGRIVFGCDDTARSGFKVDGGLDPSNHLNGKSHSNLWFTTWQGLRQVGRPAGSGGPWLHDPVRAGAPSAPYLFAGYPARVLHLAQACDRPLAVKIETGPGTPGQWRTQEVVKVPARGYGHRVFAPGTPGQWLRLTADGDCGDVTAQLVYGPSAGAAPARHLFSALADVGGREDWVAAVARSGPSLDLAVMATPVGRDGSLGAPQYYEVGPSMAFAALPPEGAEARFLRERAAPAPPVFTVDEASVIVAEGGKRYRLPRTDPSYDRAWPGGWPRGVREVVTERSLLNAHGTFYLLPRPSAGGVGRIRPVTTHGKRITDHLSWRGLLVLAGTRAAAAPDGHHWRAPGSQVGLWFGDVDDLWRLGKPRGYGGPWLNTEVRPGEPSDPYLLAGYDQKRMTLSHDADRAVRITLEVDPVADGSWFALRTFEVPPRRQIAYQIPAGYAAHWLRARADSSCRATVQLRYD